MDTHRIEAFSDGVFAVAITLLVLDLRDPHTCRSLPAGVVAEVPCRQIDLTHRLLGLWPNYSAYAVSFLVIGIIWVNHHDAFTKLKAVDRSVQFLNLLLLMTVVVIPFPTAVLAENLQAGRDSHPAAAAYGLLMALMGVAFTSLWIRVARHPALLRAPYDATYAWRRVRQSALGPLVFSVGALVGVFNASASLGFFAAISIYFAVGAAVVVDTTAGDVDDNSDEQSSS